jgi:hypothetical protein
MRVAFNSPARNQPSSKQVSRFAREPGIALREGIADAGLVTAGLGGVVQREDRWPATSK